MRAELPAEGCFGNVADEALLVRAAQANTAAFAPLYHLYYPRIYHYLRADISFTDVVLIPAEDGPGIYVVPEAPAEGTLQYTPPATLPGGLTLTPLPRCHGRGGM
ncbi:MAG TPA: hypothetical protein VEX37_10420, partial [Thermomicrobiales bacterium]|nr:hypothetical protein [Thermomicrobiales bacterium]